MSSFTKQEQVMFDNVIEGFDDMLVIAKGFDLYDPLTAQEAVNARDKFWLPAPMIGAENWPPMSSTSAFFRLPSAACLAVCE